LYSREVYAILDIDIDIRGEIVNGRTLIRFMTAVICMELLLSMDIFSVSANQNNGIEESFESYVFWAEDYQQACLAAEYYDAELVSFENGIGTLQLREGSLNDDTSRHYVQGLKQDIKLYPNYLYTIEDLSETEETETEDTEIENTEAENTETEENTLLQWHMQYFKMDSVWEMSTGKEVKVAIVDSGIDTDHEALVNNIALAESVIPQSAYGTNGFFLTYQGPEDKLGHGTHVAGIIGAACEDGSVMGIAPECKIYSYKALEKVGNTATGYTSWIANGILSAVENQVDIINLSIGGSRTEDRFIAEAIDIALENGCIVVCAAGNYNGIGAQNAIDYPASDEGTIAVSAAMQQEDEITIDLSYSKYGEGIDFIAPGTRILSTDLDGEYSEKKGTSMAAPMVSATIALLIEEMGAVTQQEVMDVLVRTAQDIGDEGVDIYSGNGVIQPLEAVKSVQPQLPPETETPGEEPETESTEEPEDGSESESTESTETPGDEPETESTESTEAPEDETEAETEKPTPSKPQAPPREPVETPEVEEEIIPEPEQKPEIVVKPESNIKPVTDTGQETESTEIEEVISSEIEQEIENLRQEIENTPIDQQQEYETQSEEEKSENSITIVCILMAITIATINLIYKKINKGEKE